MKRLLSILLTLALLCTAGAAVAEGHGGPGAEAATEACAAALAAALTSPAMQCFRP